MKKNILCHILSIIIILLSAMPITVQAQAGNPAIGNVLPRMTSNTAPDGKITAGGINKQYAYRAFDKDINTTWWQDDGNTSELTYEFSEPQYIQKLAIYAQHGDYTMTHVKVSVYDEGYGWRMLLEEDLSWNAFTDCRVLDFSSYGANNAHKKYKLSVQRTTSSFSISEIELLGYSNQLMPMLSIEGPLFSGYDNDGVSDSVYAATVYGDVYFSVFVNIDFAKNIFAEDLTVNYDKRYFEYKGASSANSKLQVLHTDTDIPGAVRFIIASNGELSGVNDSERLLELRFIVKNTNGAGEIKVTNGLVANYLGNELHCACKGITLRVISRIDADVNGDGRCSIGDIAITAFNLNKSPENWSNNKVDVDLNRSVNIYDLKLIVQQILMD